MGTVLFTGLLMMLIHASGQLVAIPCAPAAPALSCQRPQWAAVLFFRQQPVRAPEAGRAGMRAEGALASQMFFTMPALMLNRSSRVMPGLRGTPAGMTTRSTPVSAAASCCCPEKATTWAGTHGGARATVLNQLPQPWRSQSRGQRGRRRAPWRQY